MTRHKIVTGLILPLLAAVAVGACGAGLGAPANSPATSNQAATNGPSTASLGPTTSLTTTPSAAAAASCMDRATFNLLMSARDYSKLTPAQVDAIVAALSAYDYGADTTGAAWRDGFVAALKKGDLAGAQYAAGALAMGVGYGEPKACP